MHPLAFMWHTVQISDHSAQSLTQTDDGLTAPEPSSQPQDLVSLLDVGDVFGGTVAVPQAPSLLLDPNPVLEPAAFQVCLLVRWR